MGRLITGFLIAPPVAAGVTTLLTVIGAALPGASQLIHASDLDPHAPDTVFVWALLFAIAVTLVGGVPLFRIVRRAGRLNLGSNLLAGAALGIFPFALLSVMGLARAALDRELSAFGGTLSRLGADAIVGSIAGVSGALVFFFLASASWQVRGHAA
jgi:hypothetical protein